MKNTNIKLDHKGEAIRITKVFEKRLNRGEGNALQELSAIKSVFPTYRVVADKTNVKAGKRTHKGLTIDRMDFCIRRITNNNQAAILAFAEIKDNFRGTQAYSSKVRSWFLANYDEYNEYLLKEIEWQGETAEVTSQEQEQDEAA